MGAEDRALPGSEPLTKIPKRKKDKDNPLRGGSSGQDVSHNGDATHISVQSYSWDPQSDRWPLTHTGPITYMPQGAESPGKLSGLKMRQTGEQRMSERERINN